MRPTLLRDGPAAHRSPGRTSACDRAPRPSRLLRPGYDVPGHEAPDHVALSAYRIVQEAVTNVVKHAAPACCRVRVETADGRLHIDVTDDGPGARVLPGGGGHGLVGMRGRVMMYGGDFAAGPRPEGGFAASAVLPYR